MSTKGQEILASNNPKNQQKLLQLSALAAKIGRIKKLKALYYVK